MAGPRVLVAGASGHLGGVITRKLLADGTSVRALSRSAERLASVVAAGAEPAAVDMLNLPALTEACRGIEQVIATATNNMGKGPTSPNKVDLTAYQNLVAATRKAGVKRIIYVSFRGLDMDAVVDIFRVKWYIEDAIKRSGMPYVFVRPTAFLDIWANELIAGDVRKNGAATIFGDGNRVGNYVAVDDVAHFIVKILERPDVVNEVIEVGGPSNISMNQLADLVEKRLGVSGKKRRHIPVPAMKYLPPLVRPFNEVAARLMTIGLYSATATKPFPDWRKAADRFGIMPKTAEAHVEEMPR